MATRTSSNRKAMRSLAAKRGWETRRASLKETGFTNTEIKGFLDQAIANAPDPNPWQSIAGKVQAWWQRRLGRVR